MTILKLNEKRYVVFVLTGAYGRGGSKILFSNTSFCLILIHTTLFISPFLAVKRKHHYGIPH